ncbi:FUSC family protein [Microbacterium marinilacus]|uniref:FUSC family protein n=1 Tax=Microbacterium marinilacus TaxID=415209 RepID=A0ABP7BDM8_9MICO|nr:FUSC family protein [Microbacterium marinilacus]MBY0688985.1 FUSC family protein [Microbacterium marinilacus]
MSDSQPMTEAVPVTWRTRFSPRPGLTRLRESWIAVAQIVIAATCGYLIGRHLLGHETPMIAATVAISSLGLARDARPGRVAETVVGMLTGILVSEALRFALGSGWWQLAVALAVTMLLARFLSPSPQFAIAAAIQAAIAMILPLAPVPFSRLLDGVIGGVLAVVVTAVLPRNPATAAIRDARAFFAQFDAAAERLVVAVRRGDRLRAERGLEKARGLQAPLEAWRASLDSGRSIARISPFLRGRRAELERHARILQAMDLAMRNLRVVGRRIVYVCEDRSPRDVPADAMAEIVRAATLVGASIDDISQEPVARETLLAIARRLDPAAMLPGASLGEQALVSALRPLVVDLLVASGVPPAEARGAIPRI